MSSQHTSLLLYYRLSFMGLALFLLSYYSYYHFVSELHFLVIAALFSSIAIVGLIFNRFKSVNVIYFLEFLSYSFLVTYVVVNTGLAASPWIFLYVLVALLAATIQNHYHGLVQGGLGLSLYYLAVENFKSSWFIFPTFLAPLLNPYNGFEIQLLSLVTGITLVCIAVKFLKKRLEDQGKIIQYYQEKFHQLSEDDEFLIENTSAGLLLFNKDKKLLRHNARIQEIMELANDKVSIEQLNKLLPDLQIILKNDSEPEHEVEIPVNNVIKKVLVKKIVQPGNKNILLTFKEHSELSQIKAELEFQNEVARALSKSFSYYDQGVSPLDFFIGHCEPMQAVFEQINKVGPSKSTVMISGESGTGKELVARSIHHVSNVSGNFIAVNCAAIPENLIESQLFGHKKGSFTGAIADHKGYFEQADKGTIFLDEVGDLPLHLQTKLLRVLQEKKFRPVGSERDIDVSVRVLSATNVDLEKSVKESKFREDLFYRLNVINIILPPLRDRKKDLPYLISHIVKKFTTEDQEVIIPPDTLKILNEYTYPGNIRELENIIEHACVMGGEVLLPEHLPVYLIDEKAKQTTHKDNNSEMSVETVIDEQDGTNMALSEDFELDNYLAEIEKKYLLAALEEASGVKKKAADLLGVNFRSFRYRLQKFELDAEK